MKRENPHSEKELLLLVSNGDKTAFEQLFERHWDQVYGVAQRLTKSPEQSKDLAQDIFLKLWEAREKLSAINNLGSFLYTITRNLVHDHLRTKVFRESNREFLLHYFSYSDTNPRELLEDKEQEHFLHEAIGSLPPRLQEVVKLAKFEGLSHEQIAARIGITPLSSKTYMVRALVMLRKYMTLHARKLVFIILYFINQVSK